ncbi:hypothetical protein AMTRI_Chr02g211620 [Amborella trichopoda]
MATAIRYQSPTIQPLSLQRIRRARHHFHIKRTGPTRKSMVITARNAAADLLSQAAKFTVDNYIKSGMVVGLGSGPASFMVIKYLSRQLKEGLLKDIVGIPMSVSAASEAAKAGIPLDNHLDTPKTDVAFNDADIVEEDTLAAIIGRPKFQGSESVIQAKSILKATSSLVFIITQMQYTRDIDGSIPVVIRSERWMETAEEIDDLFLGDAEVWRRSAIGNAGPTGGDFPIITTEGYNILDLIFTSPISNLSQVAQSLEAVDGVVEHGVICGIPCTAVIASEDGVHTVDNLSECALRGS